MNTRKVVATAVAVGGFVAGLSVLEDNSVQASANTKGRTTVNLNFRTGAGTNHRVIRVLPRNTNLTILSRENGWLRVRIGSQEGWVSGRFVTEVNHQVGGQARTIANLNFRTGAGTTHRVMRVLPRNTNLTILSQGNGWLQVRVGSQEGWVSANFVSNVSNTSPSGNNNNQGSTEGSSQTVIGQGHTTVNLNFRTGAGTNHRIIRTLGRNTSVNILSESNGWKRIRVGNQEGWASAQFIKGVPTSQPDSNTANNNPANNNTTDNNTTNNNATNNNNTTNNNTTNNNPANNNTANNQFGGDRWNIMSRYRVTAISTANRNRYITPISDASNRHGVPIPLVQRMIEVESSFRSNAISPVGARGLMQLMPATARSLGVTNPLDPIQNINGGVRYFRQLLDRFNGNVVLSLAAYNAGISNVQRFGGVPPFFETINFIQRILGIRVGGRAMPLNTPFTYLPELEEVEENLETEEIIVEAPEAPQVEEVSPEEVPTEPTPVEVTGVGDEPKVEPEPEVETEPQSELEPEVEEKSEPKTELVNEEVVSE